MKAELDYMQRNDFLKTLAQAALFLFIAVCVFGFCYFLLIDFPFFSERWEISVAISGFVTFLTLGLALLIST